MTAEAPFEIFLAATPGLERELYGEAKALGFAEPKLAKGGGGVTIQGRWSDVWRANLELRGAGRVLVRVAAFPVTELADLEKRARRIDWRGLIGAGASVRVEAVCRKSRIYHSGAAAERIARAISASLGSANSPEAEVTVMARLDHDQCVISIDTSGEPLHKRGHKQAVGKAPLRETMAALMLRRCGFSGDEPVLDPMCGAGTFVIEAAEIAAGLMPGRARGFAFERLATFDAAAWQALQASNVARAPAVRMYGRDRDPGAVRMSRENAERAGVDAWTEFGEQAASEARPPEGPPGLVMVNPPYGGRIGDARELAPLYRALGRTLIDRFAGWRVGLVTSAPELARATGLPFGEPSAPIAHGGLKVRLYRTGALV